MDEPDFSDDRLSFLPEDPEPCSAVLAPWKVLVVDDEPGVHASTRLALRGIHFRGRALEFIDAYDGQEALELLTRNPDVAVVFLDVVMETSDAGLRVARAIREAGFRLPRIVLRTGHPGYAPEREVVVNYDIHDYKEKSSLDFLKLFTCLISALRAYDDLVAIERHRRGLVSVLDAVSWFDFRSMRRYLARMLAELSSLADVDVGDLLLAYSTAREPAAPGGFQILVDSLEGAPLDDQGRHLIARSFAEGASLEDAAGATSYAFGHGVRLVLFTRERQRFATADRALLELFLQKVAQTVDNHRTFSEILGERDGLVRAFAAESAECGEHDGGELEEIQQLCRETAVSLRRRLVFPEVVDDWFVFSIGTAAAFHDLGVPALPHRLFDKAGPLTDDERRRLQEHVNAGVVVLRDKFSHLGSGRLYPMAEEVILQHHERMDGSGYPQGLRGEQIGVAARIVAVVDTFVAMNSPRPYRPAHSWEDCLTFVNQGRGAWFDADVVDAFMDALDRRA